MTETERSLWSAGRSSKTRPRRRAEYSDDAVVWPARARHDRLPVLEPAAQSRDSVLVSYRSSDRLPMP
ncbi:MAG TPA: hypothetical protein VN945_00735, partial [Gemmatimonadales bacterium]|nr:hypothetical protein [Gemmatimonadales bacterium]